MWYVSSFRSNLTPPGLKFKPVSHLTTPNIMLGNNSIITGLHFSINFSLSSLGAYLIYTISLTSQTFWIHTLIHCNCDTLNKPWITPSSKTFGSLGIRWIPHRHLSTPFSVYRDRFSIRRRLSAKILFSSGDASDSCYLEELPHPQLHAVSSYSQCEEEVHLTWLDRLVESTWLWIVLHQFHPWNFHFMLKVRCTVLGFIDVICPTLSSLLQVHWNRNPVLFHQKPAQLFHQLLLQLFSPSDNRSTGLHLHLLVCQSLWSTWYASALCHHYWTVIAAAAGPHSVYVTSTPFVHNIILL